MKAYQWKGSVLGGKSQSGLISSPTKEEAIKMLKQRRIVVTELKEKKQKQSSLLNFRKGFSTRDLAVYTRQFATMVNAGLPLLQSLEILSKQSSKEKLKTVSADVTHDVESGCALADALRAHPEVFDDLYVNMVEAGEAAGALDEILLRISSYVEKADALKRKVKGALTYPVIIMIVAVIVTIFMLVFIIPTFAKMFTGMGGELPLPTKVVMMMSSLLKNYWWAALVAGFGSFVGVKKYYATRKGRLVIDRLLLRTPILGDLLRKTAVARFSRTLGTLVSSGVPLLSALEITARTAGNVVITNAVLGARRSIREGETVAQPLKMSGVFPPMVTQMVSVGEETGSLDSMLNKVADFYDSEVDTSVDALTSIIEPLMIVGMGLLVGGMVVAMYLPMFKMITLIQG
jgi:type IV pilus assembly protein PilC